MAYKLYNSSLATVTGSTKTSTITVTDNIEQINLRVPASKFTVDPSVKTDTTGSGVLAVKHMVETLDTFSQTSTYKYNEGNLPSELIVQQPSRLFNSQNKAAKTKKINVRFNSASIKIDLENGFARNGNLTPASGANIRHTFTLTLDAPPTFGHSELSFNKDYAYTGLTTASVDLSNMEAKYEGDITLATLAIGTQTSVLTKKTGEQLTDGTLSILLSTAGTFTPTITVVDSRNQKTVVELPAITVNEYNKPSAVMEVERASSSGAADEEGEYGLVTLDVTYTDAIAKLKEPELKIDGTVASDVTWYLDAECTKPITDWNSVNPPSPATLYGVFGSNLLPQQSYLIEVSPRDDYHYGTKLTQVLPSTFYTIDFKAGGHGIAFGQPSVQDGFECNMDATFHQDLVAQDMTTSEVSDFVSSLNVGGGDEIINLFYPVGSYYETSDTTFNPNTAWGGTWVLEAEGIVHVSAGTSYPVTHANDNAGVGAKDGGESTVTLSLDQIPSHNHGSAGPAFSWNFLAWTGSNPTGKQGGNFNLKSPGSGSALGTVYGSFSSAHTHSNNGGGQAHTNMQPYIVVNRWHRTA